ncbi:MAG: hypothetical protein WC196_04205 [Bacilli bacterium]|nr:hypothetical protein [Bacilli bacterium]MDD3422415.1 hypothetical protein [Bacilli bacterium]MDD4066182.1 hypothetical protein [Bacilli bacterium]
MHDKLREAYPWILIVLAVILYVVCIIYLPDTLFLQGNPDTGEATKILPTSIALLIPLVITIGFNLFHIFRRRSKTGFVFMYLSLIGFVIFFYMIVFNIGS